MVRTGTAHFWDMYWQPAETARAVLDSGLRATIGGPLFDADGGTEAMREAALGAIEELAEAGPWVDVALAPHSIYMVSEELLRWAAEVATERGIAIQIHLSEAEKEVTDCVAAHGVRPAAYLDKVGMLGERTVLAHGVWLDREELELIAARGATVVTNPVANLKLAVGGPFPYPAARDAGVAVGLGTDGAGSNDSLDLLSDLKAFALMQRHAAGDPTVLPAAEALEVATGSRSDLLGNADPLVAGAPADFLLLRRGAHETALGDLATDLVYAANGSVVDTTVVAGRVLMRGGVVEGGEETIARASELASRLGIA
jgi:5-methylthioadenosine/S-adenosylhomocysteine deaminase